MSRLLTTLLLYRSDFYVGKYISLEAKIAKNKDLYYAALAQAQIGLSLIHIYAGFRQSVSGCGRLRFGL